jgi:hypothetical protein
MTVEQLGAMDYREYVQWMALYEVESDEMKQAMKRAQSGRGSS